MLNLSNRLCRDASGATAVIFAISSMVLFGMLGLAVDGSRWYTARNAHSRAIDAALLAGARQFQLDATNTSGAIATATNFYHSNVPQTGIVNNTIVFSTPDNGATFTFTGMAYLQTTFLNVIGIHSMSIAVPAKAIASQSGSGQGSNLEIAVMLDVTGSMCDDGTGPCTTGTKIGGVKQAAKDLANIVLGQTSGTYTSRIALVPFSSAIRIDEDGTSNSLMRTLTNLPSNWSGYIPSYSCSGGSGYMSGEIWVQTAAGTCTSAVGTYVSNWKLIPCVTERNFNTGVGFDPSDSAPGSSNWLLGVDGDRSLLSWDSSDTPLSSGTGTTVADFTWSWNYSPGGSGCPVQPGNEVVPLTSNLTSVTNRINSLDAYGPTAGALGTVWAQYMLSPDWSGIWTGNSSPGSYADTQNKQTTGAPLLRKVAVLMTDGGFNTYRQNAVDNTTQMQTVSDYALSVCTNMKNNGIEIYCLLQCALF